MATRKRTSRPEATSASKPSRHLTAHERQTLAELDQVALKWLRLARATGDREALILGRLATAALVVAIRQDSKEEGRASEWARGVLDEKEGPRSITATAARMTVAAESVSESYRIGWDFKGARRMSSVSIDRLLFTTWWLVSEGCTMDEFPTMLAFHTLRTFPFLKDRGANRNDDLPERIAHGIEKAQIAVKPDEDSVRALVKLALVEAGMREVTGAMKYLAMRDSADASERVRLATRASASRARGK